MMDNSPSDAIRRAVLAELERRGWSRYRLVQELGGGPSDRAVIYRWLSRRRDLYVSTLARVLAALDLEIAPRGRKGKS